MRNIIAIEEFYKVDLRIGTIVKVHDFPNAIKPAFQLIIDFGPLGFKTSSAQLTRLYQKEDLIGKQIVAVANLKKKQIANFMSECLVLGVVNHDLVTLLCPEQKVHNGIVVQ